MLATRNALAKRIDGYDGCDGLKTGYHKRGGWSLRLPQSAMASALYLSCLALRVKMCAMRSRGAYWIAVFRSWNRSDWLDLTRGSA